MHERRLVGARLEYDNTPNATTAAFPVSLFSILRRNSLPSLVFPELFTKVQEGTRFAENRPRRVVESCVQAGKPVKNLLVQDIQKRRNTFSNKVHVLSMDWL